MNSKDFSLNNVSSSSLQTKLLVEQGRKQIELAEIDMTGLMVLRDEYKTREPLKGANIAGCLHLTNETGVLIETLVDLGASVRWAASNPDSTQNDVAAALIEKGIPLFAWKGMSIDEYQQSLGSTLEFENGTVDLILDDGADLTSWTHVHRPELLKNLKGISEETTTGVRRLKKMHQRGQLGCPVFDVNGSIIKTKFDNFYGTRESIIDGLKNSLDFMIAGKVILVAGYGDVGRGAAQAMKSLGGRVIISEIDPIRAYQAAMEGFEVKIIDNVAHQIDLFITATGCNKVIVKQHFQKMKNNAVLANIGHFDVEIDIHFLETSKQWLKNSYNDTIDIYENIESNKKIIVLAKGRLVNLCGGRGHSPFVMSNSFSLQTLAQIELWKNFENYSVGVYSIPRWMEEKVALLHIDRLGVELTTLSPEQAEYFLPS